MVRFAAAALFFTAGAFAFAISLHVPAIAGALGIVTCHSSAPCAGGTNAGAGPGVEGQSTAGTGVYGKSTTGTALYGTSAHDVGVFASGGGDAAIDAVGRRNAAGILTSSVGINPALKATSSGNGIDSTGSYIGIIGRAPSGSSTYPLVATDTSGHDVFYVDGAGDDRIMAR
jgi:hypothetical protein